MARSNKTNNVKIETLETRTLFSAGIALAVSEVAYQGGIQLRIAGTNGNDQITVKQTTAGLVIGNTGGWTKTVTDPISNLYVNAGLGNNSVVIDASVTLTTEVFGGGVNDTLIAGSGNTTLYGGTGKNLIEAGAGNDTLVCLGSKSDTLVGGHGQDNFWTDNSAAEKVTNVTAAENSIGAVHRVSGYYSNAPVSTKKVAQKGKAAAAPSATEPAVDAGVSYANFSNDPIFASTGPSANDIFQGYVGDCYFLSTLSATAKVDPARIQASILDLGDGTVLVQLDKNGHPVYVHEDEQLPVNSDGSLAYAGLGAQNCTWVALMEKAWCDVRTNADSYDSISTGWMDEAFAALGANPTSTFAAGSATSLLTLIAKDLNNGQAVTYGTTMSVSESSGLVEGHAYEVDSVGLDSKGNVSTLTLRNPWGCGADGTGNGYITLTAAQAYAAFTGMVAANV